MGKLLILKFIAASLTLRNCMSVDPIGGKCVCAIKRIFCGTKDHLQIPCYDFKKLIVNLK